MKKCRLVLGWFLVSLTFLGALIFELGGGDESQFSPESFEFRGLRHTYLPWTDIHLFTIEDPPYSKPIIGYWIEAGYLSQPANQPQRWDTITAWRTCPKVDWRGRAKRFWYRSRCLSESEENAWIDWSRKHPPFANKLWPEVIKLLKQAGTTDPPGLYYELAGSLMMAVRESQDERTFEKAFHEWEAKSRAIKREIVREK
jgi:hypothetical protein